MHKSLFVLSLLVLCVVAITENPEEPNVSACYCTTVPCPIVGTNRLTEGGGAVGTYVYKTTTSGTPVVSSASVSITKSNLDKGSDTTECTRNYARALDDDGTKDCDAGHILANRLGGPGNQPINIFPQNLSINRGDYNQFEGQIYDCISRGPSGIVASLSWQFSYSSSAKTSPTSITYTATFSSTCSRLQQTFAN